MAKRVRDYAAEYARRKVRERERAAREGRPYSLHRARGHGSREREALERRLRKVSRSVRVDEQGRIVRPMEPGQRIRTRGLIDRYGESDVRDALNLRRDATRAYESGDMDRAKRMYEQRDPALPDWFFWYHGIFA